MKILPFLWLLPALALQSQTKNDKPAFRPPEGVEIKKDLVYATIGARALHLDLYLPGNGAGPFPAVIYIHGGSWKSGGKNAFQRQAAQLATKGIAGACIEYRLSQEATYPAAIFDAKAAVRWLRANAAKYRIDPLRIAAAGGSAGGQLAGLLGTTIDQPEFEGTEGNSGVSSRVVAMALFNPAVDLVDFGKNHPPELLTTVTQYLGATYQQKPEVWLAASPAHHVSAKSAPALLLHGDADTTVPYKQSVAMVEGLKAAGVRAELFTAPGAAHTFFNGPPWFEPCLKRMEEFFISILKPAP